MVRPAARRTPYIVLALGLAATALATQRLEKAASQRDEARFQNAVAGLRDQIRGKIDASLELLLGASGVFAADPGVDREAFQRYVDMLDIRERHPGMLGIGFALRVGPGELADLEREIRGAVPGFRVWPTYPRPEYFPIVFLEPMDRRNQAALGFDMFSEPARHAAMARARDTGAPAATEQVTLVQEVDLVKQPGFLIYVPVYRDGARPGTVEARRAALVGLAYGPFRVVELLAGMAGPSSMVGFELVDEGATAGKGVLYRSDDGAERARFTTHASVAVPGRTWELVVHSRPSFDALSNRPAMLALGALGGLLSLLLAVMMNVQVRARARAEESDRQVQAERNNLRALFTQAPAAVGILRGPELRFELSNSLNDQLARAPLVGRTVDEAVPELAARLRPVIERVYQTGVPYVGTEVPLTLPGDRHVHLNATYQPLRAPDGSIDGVMSFAYEVTDLVRARDSMEALASDLREAVRTRDDFLSVAGHELRTPLAAMLLQLQGMERQMARGAFGEVAPALGERLNKTVHQVNRLERLVTELLDVSKISSGRLALQIESVDLGALVAEVADRMSEHSERAGCTITLDAGPVVGMWDRLRLDQVVSNVIGNAIKYGPGKPIAARVEQGDGWARLAVVDHGIGIAREDQERIFGRFERAVSTRNYGGLGLGLWITRQIVEAHGGRIGVTSAPSEGSTFTVELPLSS